MAAGSDGPGGSVGFSVLTGSKLSVEDVAVSGGCASVSGTNSFEGSPSVFQTVAVSDTDSVMLEAGTSAVLESEYGSAGCWQLARVNSEITSAVSSLALPL